MKKMLVALTITSAVLIGSSSVAQAQSTQVTQPNPVKCAGAAEHKQAQGLRLQAAQLDLTAAQAKKAAAATAGRTAAVTRFDARIAKITQRITQIQANQVKFVTRCP
jgi:hypothetical protein